MLVGKHDFKVDIWGVGKLVGSCNVTDIPSELLGFSMKLSNHNPNNRPTASVALEWAKDMFRKVTVHNRSTCAVVLFFCFFFAIYILTKLNFSGLQTMIGWKRSKPCNVFGLYIARSNRRIILGLHWNL